MKKISAILAIVLVFAMTVIPVSAASMTMALSPDKDAVEVGETITIDVTYTPAEIEVLTADILVEYNPELVTFGECDADATDENGKVTIAAYTNKNAPFTGKLATLTFTAKANGSAVFNVSFPDEDSCISDKDWEDYYADDVDMVNATVKIGSTTPEPPVVEKKFEVSAVENTDKTVVTVKDSSEVAAGTVYVANYVDDVLVSCESKPLADGDLEFAITGNVKVFVWDANNVPLVNEVIEL